MFSQSLPHTRHSTYILALLDFSVNCTIRTCIYVFHFLFFELSFYHNTTTHSMRVLKFSEIDAVNGTRNVQQNDVTCPLNYYYMVALICSDSNFTSVCFRIIYQRCSKLLWKDQISVYTSQRKKTSCSQISVTFFFFFYFLSMQPGFHIKMASTCRSRRKKFPGRSLSFISASSCTRHSILHCSPDTFSYRASSSSLNQQERKSHFLNLIYWNDVTG